MARVDFHSGLADPLDFACRLLRKAGRSGVRVLVRAPAPRLALLDRLLWTFEERDFVPHLRWPLPASAPAGFAERTPVWLVDGEAPPGAPAVLVNLDDGVPADLAAFERVIEIVGSTPDEQAEGRRRWRHYKGLGLEMQHHQNAEASGKP